MSMLHQRFSLPGGEGEHLISIQGLYKAAVLKALYDFARPLGDPAWMTAPPFSVEDARNQLIYGSIPYHIEYLNGRAIFCDLGGPILNTTHYDSLNGPGQAARAIASLHVMGWRSLETFALDEPVQ